MLFGADILVERVIDCLWVYFLRDGLREGSFIDARPIERISSLNETGLPFSTVELADASNRVVMPRAITTRYRFGENELGPKLCSIFLFHDGRRHDIDDDFRRCVDVDPASFPPASE